MADMYIVKKFDKQKFLDEEIIDTAEAMEILDVSRARMNQLIKKGKIVPAKKLKKVSLFFREDILAKADEMAELRARYRPYDYE